MLGVNVLCNFIETFNSDEIKIVDITKNSNT